MLSQDLVQRIAGMGITVVTQPYLISLPAFSGLPHPPGLTAMPLRSLLDAGVRVSGSSDAPIAGFDPLDGIRLAVSRQVAERVFDEEQCISLAEAFALYTREAARALGVLSETGTLEVGKRADLVVMSADPLAAPAPDLAGLRVERSVLAGETVYQL